MTDLELEHYKIIKTRINELEKRLEFLDSDIPNKIVRQKIEATQLTLKANTEMLAFLFGEGNLRQ